MRKKKMLMNIAALTLMARNILSTYVHTTNPFYHLKYPLRLEFK